MRHTIIFILAVVSKVISSSAQGGSMKLISLQQFDSVGLRTQSYFTTSMSGKALKKSFYYKISFTKQGLGILTLDNKEIFPADLQAIFWNANSAQFVVKAKTYEIDNGKAIVKQLFGVIDTLGRWVINPAYTNYKIPNISGDYFESNSPMKTIIYLEKDSQNNYGGSWGAYNTTGSNILPFEYNEPLMIRNSGYSILENKSKKQALVNATGQFVTVFDYENIGVPDEIQKDTSVNKEITATPRLIFKVRNGNKYGFVNTSGKVIIPIQYQYIGSFNKTTNFAVAKYNGYYGVIGDKAQIIIPFRYYDIKPSLNNHIFILNNLTTTKWGLYSIDSSKNIGNAIYDEMIPLSNNFYAVSIKQDNKEKFGIIDNTGSSVLAVENDKIFGDFYISLLHTSRLISVQSNVLAIVKKNKELYWFYKSGGIELITDKKIIEVFTEM